MSIPGTGIVLTGSYAVYGSPETSFNLFALDELGNPQLATASVTNVTATLPSFTTTTGSYLVTVNFAQQPYAVGDTFAVLLPVTVGGVTLYGNYIVQSVATNFFTINSVSPATGNATVTLNGGNPYLIYDNQIVDVGPPTNAWCPALDWTIDNFGTYLVACPTQISSTVIPPYQPIYTWLPGAPNAIAIPQAPFVNDGIFVAMPQRQIIAWGSTETGIQDPLLISWSDVNNPNQWIPLATNQAGNFRIPTGSRIVGCVQGPQQACVWTDIDIYAMQYVGPPYVYSFNKIGSGCGLIARKAAAFAQGIGYWMGYDQFFTLSADGVQPLPCPVWDVVFQQLDRTNVWKIRVAVNSMFNEIAWWYPVVGGSGENSSYVKYNYAQGLWDIGTGYEGGNSCSAWVDQSVLGPPLRAGPFTLQLFQHETSNDANGLPIPSFAQTGYIAMSEADVKIFVDWIWPDMKWGQVGQSQTANVQITFSVADYPGDTPTVYGPYTATQAIEYFYTRFRGRLVSITVGSNDLGSFWRIGNIRYRYAVDGKI
jgi:hypothetical protein